MKEKPAIRKQTFFTQRAEPLESKVKLIPHINFMIASKISKQKNLFMVLLFRIVIHRGKVYTERYTNEISNPFNLTINKNKGYR